MNFPLLSLLALSNIVSLVLCAGTNSVNFTLAIAASGTVLADCSIYLGTDDKIYAANVSAESISAQIVANGSLLVDGEDVMGIGKNYLSLVAHSNSFEVATPWSVDSGYLKLYDSDFHAVPSGEDGIYVIGSINAAAGRDDVINIGIKAVGTNGAVLDSFTAVSYYGSSSTVSVLATSQTFDTAVSTSSSANEGASVSGFTAIRSGILAVLAAFVF